MKKILLALIFLGLSTSVMAVDRYASPSGGGITPCTTNTDVGACQWSTAFPLLRPGDFLYFRSGTYNLSNGITYDCNAGMFSGTNDTTNRITIKALNERQVFFSYTGSAYGGPNFGVNGCNYITVEGFRGKRNNTPSSNLYGMMQIVNSNNIIFRRNLLTDCTHEFSASYDGNSHCIGVAGNSSNNLVEENEMYDFERYGIFVYIDGRVYPNATGNIFRRNYCNQRAYESVAGGYCMTLYPGHNAIFENNISENAGGASSNSKFTDHNHDVKFLGNILFGYYGLLADMCTLSTNARPKDNQFINNVVSTDWIHPMTNSGGQNSTWNNNTVYTRSTSGEGFSLDYFGDAGPETPGAPPNCTDYANTSTFTTTGQNNLLVAATSNPTGFSMNTSPYPQGTWSFQRSNAIGFSTPYSPSAANANWNGYAHTDAVPTAQRNCPAFILTVAQGGTASLKGTGVGGADIGANIVYAYENGVLNTSKPLWNPVTKELNNQFIGAPVTGVNDSSVQSLRNFGSRFHPNCPQSAFPTVTPALVLTITTNGGNGTGADFTSKSATVNLTGTLQ